MNITALVISAHPDDAEMYCGGTIASLAAEGKNVVIADCTAGERGTRGTPEQRLTEAAAAAKILGAAQRINLGMPDAAITESDENILKIIQVIRKYKPSFIITEPEIDHHPDHEAVHRIVRRAAFLSRLAKIESEYEGIIQEPHPILSIYCYTQVKMFGRMPDFYIDISNYFEAKKSAIMAFSSQLYADGSNEPETRLSHPEFIAKIEARARHFGALIGARYAEAFISLEPLGVRSIDSFITK